MSRNKLNKYSSLLITFVLVESVCSAQIDSLIYREFRHGDYEKSIWISQHSFYVSETNLSSTNTLTINKEIYNRTGVKFLSKKINFKRLQSFNDYYKINRIGSRGNPTYFILSVKSNNKWKIIKGDKEFMPKELLSICSSIDSLIINSSGVSWTTKDLKEHFNNIDRVDSIIVYTLIDNEINEKGYYLIKGKDLRKFLKSTRSYSRIDPQTLNKASNIKDKYLMILNNLDPFEPNLNMIKTNGKVYKNEFFLWFVDVNETLKKCLIDKNWCQHGI